MGRRFRNFFPIICVAAGLVLILAVFAVYRSYSKQDIDALRQEIYALPPNTTAKELEGMGYLNLTKVQSELPKQLDALLLKDCLAKTFVDTEEGPIIRIFASSPSIQQLKMCTNYYVHGQYEEEPGRTFVLRFEEIELDDGTVAVWLRADGRTANPEDYLLLRHEDGSSALARFEQNRTHGEHTGRQGGDRGTVLLSPGL